MIVRCRKCWKDVAVQKSTEPLKPCPDCGKAETYFHAVVTSKKREEARIGATRTG
jgi:hypothetical protein